MTSLCQRLFVFLSLFVVASTSAGATDIIVTNPNKSSLDKRFEYPKIVLTEVLKRTEKDHGPFEVRRYGESVTRNRALQLMLDGDIAVFSTPTRPEWEDKVIPVRIPIRKGILGYRLFLINEPDQDMFSDIWHADELKSIPMGGGTQWSTSKAFRKLGFSLTGDTEYESLFDMLKHRRFLYFPRGINEIFRELEDRKDTYPDMAVENRLALYLPLPTYFFVSPTRPDLAVRIHKGLMSMVRDGSLDDLFFGHHRDAIERAKLSERRILKVDNPDLPDDTPLDKPEFWYSPSS